jgi:O-antigen/teichoic acid export membrane protein
LLKKLSVVFIGGFCRSTLSIVQGFLIASLLGAKYFGLFSLAISYVGLIFGIIEFKIAEAAIKFISEFVQKKEKDKIYIVSLAFLAVEIIKGVVSTLIIALSGVWVANHIYKQPQLYGLFLVLSLSNLFMTANPTLTAFLRLGEKYAIIAWYDIGIGLIGLIGTGVTAYRTRDIFPVVIAYAVVGFIGGLSKILIVWSLFRRKLRVKEIIQAVRRWKLAAIHWKKIVRFSIYLNVTSTLRYLTKNLDVLILGKIVNLESVGAYGLARRVSNIFAFFTDPLLIVIYPEMARDWAAGRIKEVRRLFKTVTFSATAAIIAFYVGLCLSAPWFVPRFFGRDFHRSIDILWLFFPGVVFAVGLFSIYHILLTTGAVRGLFWSSMIQFFAMITLIPLFTLLWQEKGAALAVSAATILCHLYSLSVARRMLRPQAAVV